jgi:two-component system sensor histidine kinase KdpD
MTERMPQAPSARPLPAIPPRGLGRGRVLTGAVLALVLPPALEFALVAVPNTDLTTAALVQLAGAVLVAIVGGVVPAVLAAILASLLLNYFRTEPVGSLLIADAHAVLALILFLAVAVAVAIVVDVSARRFAEARRAGAEAGALSELALLAVASDDPVQALLDSARDVFGVDGAGLLIRRSAAGDGTEWTLSASSGSAPHAPSEARTVAPVDEDTLLVLAGPPLTAARSRLLGAFAAQATAARAHQQLVETERENRQLAEDNRMRTSILRAVSHDLRTPLAGIKLAVGGLLQPDGSYSEQERHELLTTTDAYADQLSALVENLLDMSRISSDSVRVFTVPTRWEEVLSPALDSVPPERVDRDLPLGLPPILADPGLLERVVANLVQNAVRHAPDSRIRLAGAVVADTGTGGAGELRVIDTGGAPLPADLDELFRPFQRHTDSGAPVGVGLGLAVARGLTEAMGGSLAAAPTPGGGLTMILRMPLATGVPVATARSKAGR